MKFIFIIIFQFVLDDNEIYNEIYFHYYFSIFIIQKSKKLYIYYFQI